MWHLRAGRDDNVDFTRQLSRQLNNMLLETRLSWKSVVLEFYTTVVNIIT